MCYLTRARIAPAFHMIPNHNNTHILGVTFLQNAFVLYDLLQNQVALAPIIQTAIKFDRLELYAFRDSEVTTTGRSHSKLNVFKVLI